MNWVSIVSGNGLSPVRRQAITWTNAGLLSIGLIGINFSEIRIGILSFSLKKMHLKLSSAKMVTILSQERWVNYNLLIIFFHWKYCAGWNHFGSLLVNRPRFTNSFSIIIQIWWKFCFTLTLILIQWLLNNFVHGTTAVLSWHVQKNFAIWWTPMELQQGEIFHRIWIAGKTC